MGSSLAIDQIFCTCYFGFVRLFFAIFLITPKGPLSIFYILQQNGSSKIPEGPPLHFLTLRLNRDFKKHSEFFSSCGYVEENTWHFEVLLLVLNLRYGADLGRSRLVSYLFRYEKWISVRTILFLLKELLSLLQVYNIRDVEKKAVCVHGSLEKIAKLEADRLKLENDLKHLKFLYGGLNEKKTSQPDKTVVVEVSVHLLLWLQSWLLLIYAFQKSGETNHTSGKSKTNSLSLKYWAVRLEDHIHFLSFFILISWSISALFCFPPYHHFFWKISENIITNRFEYKPESFSFKFILRMIVKDSDTNVVHTFSLSSYAFLIKKSTASCFESPINT